MRILFVSDEDRCRGPMARVLAERLARKHDLYDNVFDSAGIRVHRPEPAHLEVIAFMKREKHNLMNHRGKPLSVALADNADVIMCMTAELVRETKKLLGEYYAPKVVLLNDAVDLNTKRLDIEFPNLESIPSIHRLYSSLLAATGRLVRTLEEPGVKAEYFGARTIAKKLKPGTGGTGPRAGASTIDPERRRYLVNMVFDFVERSFEPPTTSSILQHLLQAGHKISSLEVDELLRQDLHGYVRVDREGAWHAMAGAASKRREKAKAAARSRAEKERPPEPPPPREDKMTEDHAFEVLAIKPDTTLADAQKKFRALIQRYHPDRFHDDPAFLTMATEKTRRINQAWAMVKDKLPE